MHSANTILFIFVHFILGNLTRELEFHVRIVHINLFGISSKDLCNFNLLTVKILSQ